MAGLKQRGSIWYLTYYASKKKRQFESAQTGGETSFLPTRAPIPDVLTGYVEHIRTIKTAKSAQTDLYYLRDMFGPLCDALKITSRKVGPKSRKRKPREGQDRRRRAPVIEVPWFEAVTTTDISEFIHAQMLSRGITPISSSIC